MDGLTSSRRAFEAARRRASVAASLEAEALHMAVYDGRAAGMSVRAVAAVLRVPKSTVARHWRDGHHCPEVPPLWGDGESYRAARAEIWAHDPGEAADDRVPYEWEDDGDQRRVRSRSRGTAVMSKKLSGDPEDGMV